MWYFVVPEVVFGPDALSHLAELKGKSAFIVTDKNIVSLGFVDKVKEQLSQAGIQAAVFDEVEPDPSLQTVQRGVALMNQYGPDLVVAVGGGSVMDAAKAMRVQYERPDIKPEEINPFISDLGLGARCKLVCVATTSGTGAEATFAIVLTDTADQRKLSLINREIVPDIAIVDPELARAMPPQITADTGMDALAHAVEGYTCTWKNDFTDGLCIKAIQFVFQYLPRAVKDGNDMEAREKMHNAGCIAGIGFINALSSMAHAAGHSLGALFHIPHGRAVGLFLPYTIEFIGEVREELWAEIAYAIKLEVPKGKRAATILAQAIRGLAHNINQPLSIKETDIPLDSFNKAMGKLIDNVMADGSLIVSARIPNVAETERFLGYTYEGKSIDF
ncbi:MAG: iron-containing alcohol dehydrogenase [Dehalococcoidia bacterium]|nr:iron-containing alcohol dehydrogenase [Dehalococcoidia bacterium]MDH4291159.1 iron-containing alcohol dehydrogenase [Dehalococcoidia bacterium]